MFGSLRFFLFLTTVVAVSSLVTYVLPGEIFLHLWQHNNTEYNIYSEEKGREGVWLEDQGWDWKGRGVAGRAGVGLETQGARWLEDGWKSRGVAGRAGSRVGN